MKFLEKRKGAMYKPVFSPRFFYDLFQQLDRYTSAFLMNEWLPKTFNYCDPRLGMSTLPNYGPNYFSSTRIGMGSYCRIIGRIDECEKEIEFVTAVPGEKIPQPGDLTFSLNFRTDYGYRFKIAPLVLYQFLWRMSERGNAEKLIRAVNAIDLKKETHPLLGIAKSGRELEYRKVTPRTLFERGIVLESSVSNASAVLRIDHRERATELFSLTPYVCNLMHVFEDATFHYYDYHELWKEKVPLPVFP